ncbi:uncharacterized protein PV09_06844 [Verruconis gallopava]|uniref:Mid2 domain-containing protein n=1 Tax=Verruconis gallopava TaxID=253628 RepID=A0A0D2A570_9PEZI|nr:uncharacterized protein PV09_06844 [Verruconis gallopava]KIW01660.1 hypothetical protein PV09_06844 [Verruconis gallopava]
MKDRTLPSALTALVQVALFTQPILGLAIETMEFHNFLPRVTCSSLANLTSCGQGLPANFCCPSETTCIPIYNTGVQAVGLCCPNGNDCSIIKTITCDTSLQDPILYPASPLHTTNTSQALPTCGSECCPLGYECINSECYIKSSSRQPSASSMTGSSTSSILTSSTSATSTSAATPSVAPATISPSTIEPKQTGNISKVGLVLVGLFPGLLAGAAIALGILFYLRRRRNRQGYKSDSASSFFGPPTPHDNKPPKISVPIYRPGMADRVVFGHNRTPSGNAVPETAANFSGYYRPNNNSPNTSDSMTLVSPPHIGKGNVIGLPILAAPFETPVKRGRAEAPEKSFFSTSSKSSRRYTQQTTGSMETISMLMGPPRVPSYQRTPEMRQTTYSDVYRAAGVSPGQVKSTRPSVDTPRC